MLVMPREQEESRGLDRRRGDDDDVGALAPPLAVAIDVGDAGRATPTSGDLDPLDEAPIAELRAGGEGSWQPRERAAARLDRTAIARAEAARIARRAAVAMARVDRH